MFPDSGGKLFHVEQLPFLRLTLDWFGAPGIAEDYGIV